MRTIFSSRILRQAFFLLFLCFLIHGSPPSHAIRVVGKGGGETEMRALSLYSIVEELTAMASKTQVLTWLGDEMLERLIQAHEQIEASQKHWSLVFRSHDDTQADTPNEVVEYDQARAFIRINLKAVENQHLRLDHVLLKAHLGIANQLSQEELEQIAQTLLPTENWEFESLNSNPGRVIKLRIEKHWGLVYNSENEWVDFAPMLKSTLGGLARDQFHIVDISDFSRQQGGFSMSVKWSMNDQRHQAKIQLQRRQVSDQWKLIVYGVKSI